MCCIIFFPTTPERERHLELFTEPRWTLKTQYHLECWEKAVREKALGARARHVQRSLILLNFDNNHRDFIPYSSSFLRCTCLSSMTPPSPTCHSYRYPALFLHVPIQGLRLATDGQPAGRQNTNLHGNGGASTPKSIKKTLHTFKPTA